MKKHRKRQPLRIKQLPLRGYEVVVHVKVRRKGCSIFDGYLLFCC